MSASKTKTALTSPVPSNRLSTASELPQMAARLSAHVLRVARDQVEHRRFSLHFAQPELERRYALQRCAEYREVVRLGWPMLLILYVMLLGMSIQFYPADLFADHGFLLWMMWPPLFISLWVGVWLTHKPRWLPYFERIITACGALVLTCFLLSYVVAQTAGYADHAMLNIGLLLLIMAFAARIRVWMFAGMLLLAIVLALLGAVLIGSFAIEWLKLGHATVLYGAVTIFVMALVEANHRLAFLQGIVLVEQAQDLQALHDQLDSAAREDLLSGLPNRRAFDDIFRREWERTRRDQRELSLLYLDLDYFSLYNDNYGVIAGDALLQQVAQLLRSALMRPADQACRYSGESFVLILPNTNTQGAIEVARRVIQSVDRLAVEHRWSQVASHVTVSVGLATSLDSETDPHQLLIRADDALYQAKQSGRHRLFVNG